MKRVTVGREFNAGAIRSIYHEENETFLDERTENECYMLVLISKGSAIMELEGKRRLVSAPCLICVNEKERLTLIEGNDLGAQSIYFHPYFLNMGLRFENVSSKADESIAERHDRFLLTPFVEREDNYDGILPLEPMVHQRICELFMAAGSELRVQSDWYWSCRCRSYFMEILISMERIYSLVSAQKYEVFGQVTQLAEEYKDIQSILLHIHTNYFEVIHVKELSQKFHTNRTTLSKRFKEATGCTVIEYVNKYRVYIAGTMLIRTNLYISEIAGRLGFMDDTHFSRVFRKYAGTTPIKYRELGRMQKSS